jgi:uncharacterized membrane protein
MNATKLNLISRIFQYLSIAVGVVLSILILMSGPSVADGKEAIEKFRESAEMNAAIYFILFILLTGGAMVIGFFIFQIIQSPKRTILSIIGIVLSLIVYMIFYLLGTSDTKDTLALRNPVSDGVVLTTTAGLYTVGILLFVGLVVIIAGPFMGRLRK